MKVLGDLETLLKTLSKSWKRPFLFWFQWNFKSTDNHLRKTCFKNNFTEFCVNPHIKNFQKTPPLRTRVNYCTFSPEKTVWCLNYASDYAELCEAASLKRSFNPHQIFEDTYLVRGLNANVKPNPLAPGARVNHSSKRYSTHLPCLFRSCPPGLRFTDIGNRGCTLPLESNPHCDFLICG